MPMALLRRVPLWLPPLLLMAAIFFFSAQPDLDSGLGAIDLVTRKLVHLLEYALLCFLWWRAFSARVPPGRAALAAFVVSALYAITDEFHQSFVEGRSGSPLDVAIDSTGAALAALRLRSRAREQRAAV
jgi:VanZ family protein